MATEIDEEHWENVLESTDEYSGSSRPEGLYIPGADIVNLLQDISDPRHQAIGYVMDEAVDGMGWQKYPEDGSVPREEVAEFIDDLNFSSHADSTEYLIDELTSPRIESRYQFPYLEEQDGEISLGHNGSVRVGDEISTLNLRIESDIVDYLQERKFDEAFVDREQLKDDLVPPLVRGHLMNSSLSMRNPQVARYDKRHESEDPREKALDISLMRLGSNNLISEDPSEDSTGYRSQLNPVQEGLYHKVNPKEGDYDVVMTDRHRARIVPKNI